MWQGSRTSTSGAEPHGLVVAVGRIKYELARIAIKLCRPISSCVASIQAFLCSLAGDIPSHESIFDFRREEIRIIHEPPALLAGRIENRIRPCGHGLIRARDGASLLAEPKVNSVRRRERPSRPEYQVCLAPRCMLIDQRLIRCCTLRLFMDPRARCVHDRRRGSSWTREGRGSSPGMLMGDAAYSRSFHSIFGRTVSGLEQLFGTV